MFYINLFCFYLVRRNSDRISYVVIFCQVFLLFYFHISFLHMKIKKYFCHIIVLPQRRNLSYHAVSHMSTRNYKKIPKNQKEKTLLKSIYTNIRRVLFLFLSQCYIQTHHYRKTDCKKYCTNI